MCLLHGDSALCDIIGLLGDCGSYSASLAGYKRYVASSA